MNFKTTVWTLMQFIGPTAKLSTRTPSTTTIIATTCIFSTRISIWYFNIWLFQNRSSVSYSLFPPHDHSLTHWPLEFVWDIIYVIFKRVLVFDGLGHLLWNCPNMNVTGLHWWSVNIDSGNGLVPSGNKPLPEPMLTQISVTIWRH